MAIDIGSIVARLLLDRQDFTDSLAAARAEAAGFPDIQVRLDTTRFDSEFERVLAERDTLSRSTEANVGLDAGAFTAEAASIEAIKSALGRGVEIPVHWTSTASGLLVPPGAGGADRGLTSPVLADRALGPNIGDRRIDIYHHASSEGQGGGSGLGGVLSALLLGGGSRLPLIGGTLAGVGSIGSFAGLGTEHVLMTLLGLAGSAAAGAAGGGLLGLGSLGKFGVGMGSDAAVMSSTIGDTRKVAQAYDNLQRAVALYGQKSIQATAAQYDLNAAFGNVSPAARAAELGLAHAGSALDAYFDKATSAARVQAVAVLDQVLNLGRTYIPLVANAAYANLGVIDSSIKPLFAWLEGPQGKGVFLDLERMFINELPTAVHAGSQALELFLKTVDAAAGYTGGFMDRFNAFVTKWNSPPDFAKWKVEIGRLVADFHMWDNLIHALGRDIYLLFHQDAGTAGSIVGWLTQMLTKLGQWEASTRGAAQIHSVFEVHKQEILALLQLLPGLLTSFGRIYLTVAPALTTAFTDVLRVMEPVLNALAHFAPTAWVLGLSLIAVKLLGFKGALSGLTSVFGLVQKGFDALTLAMIDRSAVAGAAMMGLRSVLASPWTWAIGGVVAGLLVLNHLFQGADQSAINASRAVANNFVSSLQQSNAPLGLQIQNIRDQIHALQGSNTAMANLNSQIEKMPAGGLGFDKTLQSNETNMAGNNAAIKVLNTALNNLLGQQAQQVSLSTLLTGKNATFANSMYVLSGSTSQASSSLSQYQSLLNQLSGNTQNAIGAQLQMRTDLLNVSSSLHTTGASMSGTNQASITLQQSVLSFARDLSSQYMTALANAGTSTGKIASLSEAFVSQLNAMLKAAGYAPAAISAFDKQFAITNPTIATAAANLKGVVDNANLGNTALSNLTKHPWTIKVDAASLQSANGYAYALGQTIAADSGQSARLAGAIARQNHRAAGGPVVPGTTYLVGENGPEPFVPDVPGTILPNSALSAGGPLGRSSAGTGGFVLNDNRSVSVSVGGASVSIADVKRVVCAELDAHDKQLTSTLKDLGVTV